MSLARSLRDSGEVGAAAALFEALAADEPNPEHAAELWLLGASARSWHDARLCLRNVEAAVELATAHGSPSLTAHVEGQAAYWRLLWNGWEEGGRAAGESAVAASIEGGREAQLCTHRAQLAFFLALEAEYDSACRSAGEAHGAALRLGAVSESLLADFFRVWALTIAGRWQEARLHVTRAQAGAETNGHLPWVVLFGVQHAWLEVEVEAAQAFLAGSVGEGCPAGDPRGPSALQLAELAAKDAAPLENLFILSFAECVLALALVNGKKEGEAQATLDRLSRRNDEGTYLMDWLIELPRSLGAARLGLLSGSPTTAIEAAETLASKAGAMGEDTFLALGHALSSEAKLQAGDRRGARSSLKKALAIPTTSPMALWRVHALAATLDAPSNAARSEEHRAAAVAHAEASR